MPTEATQRYFPRILFLTAFVIAADQATKFLITNNLAPWERRSIVDGFFQLHFIVNSGGLFGSFRDLPNFWRAAVFTVIPIVASLGLLYFLLRTERSQRALRSGLALILGGAIGNLFDRIRLGHVIDFLDVYWRGHHWPAFNVADTAICVGVGLILLDAFRAPAAAEPTADPEPEKTCTPS